MKVFVALSRRTREEGEEGAGVGSKRLGRREERKKSHRSSPSEKEAMRLEVSWAWCLMLG